MWNYKGFPLTRWTPLLTPTGAGLTICLWEWRICSPVSWLPLEFRSILSLKTTGIDNIALFVNDHNKWHAFHHNRCHRCPTRVDPILMSGKLSPLCQYRVILHISWQFCSKVTDFILTHYGWHRSWQKTCHRLWSLTQYHLLALCRCLKKPSH